ncbi:MAG: biotin--[acetyl-CoA-carboxylase] ligase [Anaerolineales bacterium]
MKEELADLYHLPLGGIRYFERTSSTMDEASLWLEQGAADLALVLANEQTAGRGRLGRKWYTPPNAALAFSLILKPSDNEQLAHWMLFSGLAAVSICEVLEQNYDLQPQIKWPNDILLDGKKTAGILIESHWEGEKLTGIVIGVGINIAPPSVPPSIAVLFPATCLEDSLALSPKRVTYKIDRFQLLAWVLERLIHWRNLIHLPIFKQNWEARLAYHHQEVQIFQDINASPAPSPIYEGILLGLNEDGSLRIQNNSQQIIHVNAGEIRLRVK